MNCQEVPSAAERDQGRGSSGSLTRSGVRGAKPRHTHVCVHVHRRVSVCVSIQESRG